METKEYYKAKAEIKRAVKQRQKDVAREIRELKDTRKQVRYGYVPGLDSLQHTYRIKHIAYCMFFNGRSYNEIEQNPKEEIRSYAYDNRIKRWQEIIREREEELTDAKTIRANA